MVKNMAHGNRGCPVEVLYIYVILYLVCFSLWVSLQVHVHWWESKCGLRSNCL